METIPKEAPQAPDVTRTSAEDVDDDEPPLMHESEDDDTPKRTEDSESSDKEDEDEDMQELTEEDGHNAPVLELVNKKQRVQQLERRVDRLIGMINSIKDIKYMMPRNR